MKITKSQLENIIREELALVKEAGDPIGPVEAQKMAELLQNLGFTLSRVGMNSFIEFLQGLENSGYLNASPDTRRGALAELALMPEMDRIEWQAAHQDATKQEYDALTTMISRIDGMASFLLNTYRQRSDEALTQQAAEQLNALRDTLSQLRKGL